VSYMLDTNTCIRYLNGQSAGVLRRLQSLAPEEIFVCSIVKAELYFGAMKSTQREQTLAKQQQFLESVCLAAV